MAGFGDYVENAVLNWMRGTAMPTAPAAMYVGLFSSDPTDANTGGTEVTTTIRVAGRVAGTFGAASGGSISNTAAVDFGNAAGAATVTHFAIFDAATSGNKLFSGALAASKSVGSADPTSFAIGALVLTVD
jgi:hypothetical protein